MPRHHPDPSPARRRALPLTLLLLALVPRGVSGQAGELLKASDVFDMEFASDPRISPDGSQVVYVRQFSDVMTDQRYSNLWIVRSDGSGERALTTGNFSDAAPRWSPDGSRLLFVSDRDGSPQVWVYWMDTGQLTRVTSVQRAPHGPAWSPDGRWVAFTMLVPAQRQRIADIPAPPKGAQWHAPARVLDRLIYQFNGVGELEAGFAHLFVVPSEGGTARQLSTGDRNFGGGAGRGSGSPSWTPDGKEILISANLRPDAEIESRDTEVYAFDVQTGRMQALTDRRGPDNGAVASPDGKLVAYTGFDDRHQGYQVTKLYVMNRDGSGSRVLTEDLDRDARDPQWAADGSGLYIQYDDQGDTKVGFVPLRGGAVRELAEHVGTGGSSYSGGSYTVARDGRIAMTWSTPTVPGDVAVDGPGDQPSRAITSVNEDLLGHKRLGATEEFWYESSKDGRRIQGWIIKPPDFDPSRRYPLLLEIHGGPFANYGDRFDMEKQVFAADGFVVLYVNPRGSTSYGEEFGNLIHYAYPGDDFYDLNSGVDAVIEKGYVSPDSLYVTGGSGGGVLTAWMIGRTDRFRAAVVQYPVINWYSFALTSDIPSTVNRYWFPGPPWENAEQYNDRSVISLAGHVKTPAMIITGEADHRTPMSESEQYYQALKIAGVEAVLVKVPDEPHGIRRFPSHHMEKIAYIQGWLDRYRGRAAARPVSHH